MDIRFKIDPNRMTLGDRIALEEASEGMTNRHQRDILARQMVDDNDAPVDYKKACKVLDGLLTPQFQDAVDKYLEAVQKLREELVPPT